MSKLTKPVPDDDDDLFGPALSDAEIEAWFVRNRDALNASLDEARRDLAEGRCAPWNTEEIIAEGLRKLAAKGQ